MRRATFIMLLTLGPPAAPVLAADPADATTGPAVSVRNAYVDAYLRSQPESIIDGPPVDPPPLEDTSPLLNRLELAGPWLKLVGSADAESQWVEADCAPRAPLESAPRLCGLRWRKNNAFSDLSTRLDDFSRGMKSRVVGKGLADHLEVDVDSSPEIRLKWEFE